ncbi:tetratricopeptide repeat protein [Shewanella subflava]|uniref:Tetratricopeptide repeat protein n=1 Tax=Shewanella subflava TaxID=2986476 RepID=A0ABT3IE43_9GAMM|nr:tetratricopeptide repeat protein [Shewanella subflava]MCW3174331.1 tetratricopeptide repeat protein [Shewanella subflava]
MRHFIVSCLLFLLLTPIGANADELEEQEIRFRESPQTVFQQLNENIQFPLSFSNSVEFDQIANKLNMAPELLVQKMILLARLNLESNVNSATKYDDAQTLINQIEMVLNRPLDQAVLIMLKARLKARKSQDYMFAIDQYNEALNKVSSDLSEEAILFKFTLHEHLSGLYQMVLQPAAQLSHLNRYREIAYQMRNDYFIALSELELGRYYNRRNEHAKSLQYYSEAFRVGNRINYPGIKAHAQMNLARTYRDLEQWDEALKHAHDAATSFQALGQDSFTSEALTVIAMVYAEQKQWNQAIVQYLNALQVNERLGNEIGQGLNHHNLAEAYFNLDNGPAALTSIAKANAIFTAKKVKHYLVFNEALYAQILMKQSMWIEAIEHANKALTLAKEKNLKEQELEALKYLSTAYRQLGDLASAINIVDSIIALTNVKEEQQSTPSATSELTEQKLKFDLNLLQNKIKEQATEINHKHFLIISLASLLIFIAIILLVALSRSNKIISAQREYKKQYLLEPITQLNGLRACLQRLTPDKIADISTFALVKIEALTHSDTQMGLTEAAKVIHHFINDLSQILTADIYVIKPGQFACCFHHTIGADELQTAIDNYLAKAVLDNPAIPCFNRNMAQSNIYIGHLSLPLLANPDVNISAELHFETAQYALATAMTQSQSSYVSLKTLNFAPATIFSAPLYLNLTQALKRGIMKAESNQAITEKSWPK